MRRAGTARKANRASGHGITHNCLHLLYLSWRCLSLGRLGAHHPSTHRRVADVGGSVDDAAFAAQHIKVFGESLKAPVNTAFENLQRHPLNLREVAHGHIAVSGLARSDGKAAIPNHRRGDTKRRRRFECCIPGDLCVKVGMTVDDARHQSQTVAINDLM